MPEESRALAGNCSVTPCTIPSDLLASALSHDRGPVTDLSKREQKQIQGKTRGTNGAEPLQMRNCIFSLPTRRVPGTRNESCKIPQAGRSEPSRSALWKQAIAWHSGPRLNHQPQQTEPNQEPNHLTRSRTLTHHGLHCARSQVQSFMSGLVKCSPVNPVEVWAFLKLCPWSSLLTHCLAG